MKNYELNILNPNDTSDVRRVELTGCLDSHTVVDFEKKLHAALTNGIRKVLIDLSGLNYISSAGISALMSLTHRLRKNGGDLVLVRPTDKVLRVFRTLGFTNIFTIVEDEAGAQKQSPS